MKTCHGCLFVYSGPQIDYCSLFTYFSLSLGCEKKLLDLSSRDVEKYAFIFNETGTKEAVDVPTNWLRKYPSCYRRVAGFNISASFEIYLDG